MPWKIVKDSRCTVSKPFGVVKESDNELEGCHATRKKAQAQLAALNIAEQKEIEMTVNGDMEIIEEVQKELVEDENKEVETKEIEEVDEKFMDTCIPFVPFTSFEEMEASQEAREKAREITHLAESISPMVSNVVHDSEIDNDTGITKIFNGFRTRLNKLIKKPLLPIKEATKEVKEDITEEKAEEVIPNKFMVYKGKDGEYLWLSAYSNNIRDDDNPAEIIASESHANFVKMVDDGEVPLPELWLWHTPALVLGKATSVAYDEDSGFAIAAGYFNKEAEPVAIAIEESDIDWGVSHGMPRKHIVRSKDDPTIIVQHVTREISPLPLHVAANKYANFSILKEANMTLSEDKKREITDTGVPESALDALLESNQKVSDSVDESGLERKEVDAEVETVEDEPETVFSTEQYEQLSAIFEAQAKSLMTELPKLVTKVVEEKLEPITKAMEEEEKSQEEQVKETIANTPMASINDLLSQNLFSKLSATVSDETRVDGRTKLAKSMPEEYEDEVQYDNPMHEVFENIMNGKHLTPSNTRGS